jgi:hypothetical protein
MFLSKDVFLITGRIIASFQSLANVEDISDRLMILVNIGVNKASNSLTSDVVMGSRLDVAGFEAFSSDRTVVSLI